MKHAAHQARRNLTLGQQIDKAIRTNKRKWMDVDPTEKDLLDEYNQGKLTRMQKTCDDAFGWNRFLKSAAGSGASRLGHSSDEYRLAHCDSA